jgi:hypothetical protein
MKEFVEKLIERLEEKAIKTLGINRSQFAMDNGWNFLYHTRKGDEYGKFNR